MSESKGLSRREFLTATAAGVSLAAAGEAQEAGGRVMVKPRQMGEPYELAGKRLVFTDWSFVRPGSFAWIDEKGENVSVRGSHGPWEARFVRWEFPKGIRIAARQAQRVGPITKSEKPWESESGVNFGTVIRDGGKYRAWASNSYFESSDGMHWERPQLGLVEHGGSKKNNLVTMSLGGGTVFVDPSGPPSERYKWVCTDSMSKEQFEAFKKKRPDAWDPRAHRPDVEHYYAIIGATSPDGLTWTSLPEPLVVEHSDTQVTGYYDTRLRKYVVYTRNYMIKDRSETAYDGKFRHWYELARRSIGRTESEDFREFPLSEVILEPGPEMAPYDLLYTNCKTTIPGAPDLHLMFPTIWHAAADDATSVAIASSHDSKVWHFIPGSPVFETPPFGEWDGGAVFANPGLIELPDGAFALPYTGYDVPHKYPRGRWHFATGYMLWPKGRIIALEADELGEFTAGAFLPPGRKMRINAVTRRGGSIQVEVADLNRNTIQGRSFAESIPIIGDQYRTLVTWKGGDDLGHKEGAAITLRFKLDRAQIYGLDFE
jgi:hypothetical protein